MSKHEFGDQIGTVDYKSGMVAMAPAVGESLGYAVDTHDDRERRLFAGKRRAFTSARRGGA
jgi:hypothetical protein